MLIPLMMNFQCPLGLADFESAMTRLQNSVYAMTPAEGSQSLRLVPSMSIDALQRRLTEARVLPEESCRGVSQEDWDRYKNMLLQARSALAASIAKINESMDSVKLPYSELPPAATALEREIVAEQINAVTERQFYMADLEMKQALTVHTQNLAEHKKLISFTERMKYQSVSTSHYTLVPPMSEEVVGANHQFLGWSCGDQVVKVQEFSDNCFLEQIDEALQELSRRIRVLEGENKDAEMEALVWKQNVLESEKQAVPKAS